MRIETPVGNRVMRDFEAFIGRVLIRLTYLAVAFLMVGVGLMAASAIGPLDGGPSLDVRTLLADLVALRPAAFLWLGLGIVLATPISRVTAAGVAYGRQRQWSMVIVSIGILAVIAIGVAGALSTEI